MTEAAPAPSTRTGSTDTSAAIAAAFQKVDSTPKGLSSHDATARLQRFGRNAIEAHTESRWHKLAGYFWGPLPWMIEAAALISAIRGDWPDFAVVASLLIYNAVVGF
jgi:H+-transporting ATPase